MPRQENIDKNVVILEFDNKKFKKNIAAAQASVDDLKGSLNFDEQTKTVDKFGKKVEKIRFSSFTNQLSNLNYKFDALKIAAISALDGIVKKALVAGEQIVNALTIKDSDMIASGYMSYENELSATQTILTNYAKAGETAEETTRRVTKEIDRLYSVAEEMGSDPVKLLNLVSSISGAGYEIADAVDIALGTALTASTSGKSATSQAFDSLMYYMSQGISGGKLGGQALRSLKEQGIFTKSVSDAFTEAALMEAEIAPGITGRILKEFEYTASNGEKLVGYYRTAAVNDADEVAKAYERIIEAKELGDTTEVDRLTNEFKSIFAKQGDISGLELTADELKAVTTTLSKEAQIYFDYADKYEVSITEAIRAVNAEYTAQGKEFTRGMKAFTDVFKTKSFTEMMDYLKLVERTGWKNIIKSLIGDYEQAVDLWSDVTDLLYEPIAAKIERRQDTITEWAGLDKGGRADLIEAFKTIISAVQTFNQNVRDAFNDTLGLTSETLQDIVLKVKSFFESVSEYVTEHSESIYKIFKGIFGLFRSFFIIIGQIYDGIIKPIAKFVLDLFDVGVAVDSIGDALIRLNDWIAKHNIIEMALNELGELWDSIFGQDFITSIKSIASFVKDIINNIVNGIRSLFGEVQNGEETINVFQKILEKIKAVVDFIAPTLSAIGNFFKEFIKIITPNLYELLFGKDVEGSVDETIKELTPFEKFLNGILDLVKTLKIVLDDIFGAIGTIFSEVSKGIQDFFNGEIEGGAKSVAIVAGILLGLKLIGSLVTGIYDFVYLHKLGGIGSLFGDYFELQYSKAQTAGILKLAASLLSLAVSLTLLSKLNYAQIGTGLGVLTVGLIGLAYTMNFLSSGISGPMGIGETIIKGSGKRGSLDITKKYDAGAQRIKAIGTGLLSIALSVAVLMTTLSIFANSIDLSDTNDLIKKGAALVTILGMLFAVAGAVRIMASASNNGALIKIGGFLTTFSIFVLSALGIIEIMAGMISNKDKLSEYRYACADIIIMLYAVAGAIRLAAIKGGSLVKATGFILSFTTFMYAMLGAVAIISNMITDHVDNNKISSLIAAAASVIILLATITAAIRILASESANIMKVGRFIFPFIFLLASVIGGIAILADMYTANLGGTIGGTITVISTILSIAVMFKAMKDVFDPSVVKKAAVFMLAVLPAFAAIGAIIYLMQDLSLESAISISLSVGVLIWSLVGVLAIMFRIANKYSDVRMLKAWGSAGIITLVIAGLSYVIKEMASIPVGKAQDGAWALVTVLGGLVAALLAMSIIADANGIGLVVGAAVLGAFIYILSLLTPMIERLTSVSFSEAMGGLGALLLFLLGLAGVLAVLSLVGILSVFELPAVSLIERLNEVILKMSGTIWLLKDLPVDRINKTVDGFKSFLWGLVGILAVLALIGTFLGIGSFIGVSAFQLLIGSLTTLAAVMGSADSLAIENTRKFADALSALTGPALLLGLIGFVAAPGMYLIAGGLQLLVNVIDQGLSVLQELEPILLDIADAFSDSYGTLDNDYKRFTKGGFYGMLVSILNGTLFSGLSSFSFTSVISSFFGDIGSSIFDEASKLYTALTGFFGVGGLGTWLGQILGGESIFGNIEEAFNSNGSPISNFFKNVRSSISGGLRNLSTAISSFFGIGSSGTGKEFTGGGRSFGSSQKQYAGISPVEDLDNSYTSYASRRIDLKDAISGYMSYVASEIDKDYAQTVTTNITDNSQVTNNFYVTGSNPREIALEVSRILQEEVDERGRTWE